MNTKTLIILAIFVYFSPVYYHSYLAFKAYKKNNKEPFRRLKKFLKYTLIVFFFIVGIMLALNHTNFLNYERPLTYDKIDQITFENFRGLEFFKKSLYGNKQFAYVVTSIETNIDKDSVSIISLFHPARSYVYNTHSKSKELLTHEIYHIKINELYVRKMKAELAALKNLSESEIKDVIQDFTKEKNIYQKKYDYDTFHSYVLSEQKKYEKEVDSLLELLIDFKSPKIKIND